MKITVSKDGFKSKKLLHNTGRAVWIAGTIFLILAVPLIIEMDCEQQVTDLEMQQASILGSPSKDKVFKLKLKKDLSPVSFVFVSLPQPPRDGASPPPTIGPVYSNLTTSLSTPSTRLSKHLIVYRASVWSNFSDLIYVWCLNLSSEQCLQTGSTTTEHRQGLKVDDDESQAGANQIVLRPFLLPRANQKPPIHEAVSAILFILVVSLNLIWRRY